MTVFTQPRWWTKRGGLACLIALGLLWPLSGTSLAEDAEQKEEAPPGKQAFNQYCASCHGVSATGNGPMAETLKKAPPNLTELSVKNGGEFPRQHVVDTIDGRADVRAHGMRDMPVWGTELREAVSSGDERGGVYARTTIMQLTNYIESIQKP